MQKNFGDVFTTHSESGIMSLFLWKIGWLSIKRWHLLLTGTSYNKLLNRHLKSRLLYGIVKFCTVVNVHSKYKLHKSTYGTRAFPLKMNTISVSGALTGLAFCHENVYGHVQQSVLHGLCFTICLLHYTKLSSLNTTLNWYFNIGQAYKRKPPQSEIIFEIRHKNIL